LNGEAAPARVFLVGCPRSGTTLLQALLAAHPRILSFPETHFFSAVRSRHRALRLLGIARHGFRKQLSTLVANADPLGVSPPPPHFLLERHYATWFMKVLDTATYRAGCDVWLEKTPSHVAHIARIERLIPGARFVHLIRDGRDVIASLYDVTNSHPNAWGGARDINACIDRWLRDVERSARYLQQSNHLGVRYERLVSDPSAVLQMICYFLDVQYSDDMLNNYADVACNLILTDESWKANTQRPVGSRSNIKFDQIFTVDEREYILEKIAQIDLDLLLPPKSTQ
jgi:hypothetical protein